jgi:hypothetical protein
MEGRVDDAQGGAEEPHDVDYDERCGEGRPQRGV